MSITESIQSGGVASLKSAAAIKASQPRRNRIRRGQKLDEVVSTSEERLSQIASGNTEGKASSSSSLPSGPGAPGPSASSSLSNAAGGDSPFQLQEYLAMLVRRDPHNVEAITSLPTEADIELLTTTDKGKSKDDSPPTSSDDDDDSIFQSVDTDIWVYEQLRRLVLDLTTPWLTSLQLECDKHFRPSTCAAMNAGDWMYLCASHGEEKQCCAIDYMVHTLDGATSLLNSARHFPSRTYVPNTSLRHFGSIARRLSRIFVHAWCYHKDVFLACEAETSLYERFYVLVEKYDLTATDNLPPRPGHGGGGEKRGLGDAGEGDEKEFSRGAPPAPFTLNGTTAKRERSGTAALRSLLTQQLSQSRKEPAPTAAASTAPAGSEVDAVGLVPPPAPSPRPTAILSRPDHEEGDQDDAPAWTTFARQSRSEDDEDEDEDDDAEEEAAAGGDSDDQTHKIGQKGEDDDATINLRSSGSIAGLSSVAVSNETAKKEYEDKVEAPDAKKSEEKSEEKDSTTASV
ncbi:uncharacterized protein UBRO_00763 [Ustilago bromivora]|uniref:Uncharacterized protein n=1 Tax=Ustilago bromivora TaxID=307758 RepID=A0A1K0H0H0_9BASI|nr:uncharacterized protein UBRO_00763 [Ustilago bromivora]SYW82879.1 uncharacterized protein UBRO2_05001 [Ustilago bromivora]